MDEIFPVPIINPPEYRLYYDDNGRVICYTNKVLDGNFIHVDVLTYHASRLDIRVVNGVIVKHHDRVYVTKQTISDVGTRCCIEDINIIVPDSYTGDTNTWNAKTHEFKYS
jgi:hypothetical protein